MDSENHFIYNYSNALNKKTLTGKVRWLSPSNIALVKYWGKHGLQLPKNPSLSFTLRESHTITELEYKINDIDDFSYEFYFDGKLKPEFNRKLEIFFQRVKKYFPFMKGCFLRISSWNTFPHSSGIASSASGLSALSLCLCSIEKKLLMLSDNDFYRKASFISRIGSGSASRSVYGGAVVWGQNNYLEASSDLFSIEINREIHAVFKTFKDSILILSKEQKKVSSTAGHELMNGHYFASSRFLQANSNLSSLLKILKNGDLKSFVNIVENEALSLHAMMMTSDPWFILMTGDTVEIINEIKYFREESKIPLCFTLDAGPNLHLLYPDEYTKQVLSFINSLKMNGYRIQNIIFDKVGPGPKEIIL